jgi:adenylate kinase family enzyme/nucleoside diphosphate kinase
MLALDEKVRTVVLLETDLNEAEGQAIFTNFQESYLDVKAQKQVFMTGIDSDAFFHYLPKAERPMGLMDVLVLENIDGTAVEETMKVVAALEAKPEFPKGLYCSQGQWEAARDLEYFFPHLDSLPTERTLALIKPDGMQKGTIGNQTLEEVVEAKVAEAGLLVVGKRQLVLEASQAQDLCKSLKGTPDYDASVGVLRAEPGVVAFCLEGPGAVGKWNILCGPRNSEVARKRAPNTLRAAWGTDGTSNAVHASAAMEEADQELAMLFPEGSLAMQRTLCIVKPDAMPALLQIRQAIETNGFTVLAEKQTVLTEDRASDFYRDLKDKPYFSALVKHACSGPCCILVLCRLEAISVWQQLIGPEVVKDAKQSRPTSLRAQFGRDGQRNAVHGSDSLKSAAREVRFFFPEMGADPAPTNDEVRDYLFRKTATASMDLKTLSEADDFNMGTVDPTLQQLLSRGLLALCQTQPKGPKGLGAVKWLSRWLMENNPNTAAKSDSFDFQPTDRTQRFVEYGINQDGLAFAVEAPPPAKKKQVVEVDVSLEEDGQRTTDLTTPPFVVFLLGGPGVGKGTQCAKLREDFNLVHLSTGDLMRQEVAAGTHLGSVIREKMQQGKLVPDTVVLQLLKKTMVKHQDTNRFILDGFPRSVEQATLFEQEIAEIAFGVYFEATPETMRSRVAGRAASAPGRVDDDPDTVNKRIKVFEEQTIPTVDFYEPIGKIRRVNIEKEEKGEEKGMSEKSVEEVYAETKRFFSCRFVYLLGPPGAPLTTIAERMEGQHGYSSINFPALLKTYLEKCSDPKDAEKVIAALKKGKPVDASVACPLVLSEVYRDMALGVQNFVICDFPQTSAQSDFLEYRIPSTSKTLLLDFERADAEDLAAFCPTGNDALEDEVKINALFGDAMKAMKDEMKSRFVSIPCTLSGIERPDQLVDATWNSVRSKIMPGLTIVLGLPGSGTEVLANQLATLTPNTYVVDCDQLLDKELQRRTEMGLTMHNMLARGQVVPFSMTLELLKNVANLTCSDNLVVLNCPMYVDQIQYVANEFRIDRVFYIKGNSQAVSSWKDAFVQTGSSEDSGQLSKSFDEYIERLEPITVHFARIGKLEQFDVNERPNPDWLRNKLSQCTMPQFAIISGVSGKTTAAQASMLASEFGVGPALTTSFIEQWAKESLKRLVDSSKPEEFFPALQQYADAKSLPLLVLDRYPVTDKDAAAFLRHFGSPAAMVSIEFNEEQHKEDYTAENPDVEDNEELDTKLADMRKFQEKATQEFKNKCAPCVMSVNWADRLAAETAEDDVEKVKNITVSLGKAICNKLLPKVYVLVAPSGKFDFSSLIANAICAAPKEGGRPVKFTVIDSDALFRPGGHSNSIEDKLSKAAFTAKTPDSVPASLWKELFTEALQQSANPMGSFIVTNFPTQCSLASTPTIRDQFSMLESISTFMGIVHVQVSETAFSRCVGQKPSGSDDYAAYVEFSGQVKKKIVEQIGNEMIKECIVDQVSSAEEAAKIAAADFLSFQEKAEQVKR